jgi:hypothetical protein
LRLPNGGETYNAKLKQLNLKIDNFQKAASIFFEMPEIDCCEKLTLKKKS